MTTTNELSKELEDIAIVGVLEETTQLQPNIHIRHWDKVIRTIHQLREEVMSQEYVTWIRSKYGWSMKTFNEITWDAFHRAMTQFEGHQNSIRKYIHGWLPVAEMVQRYNKNEITMCPCCQGRERQDHILQCPGEQSKAH